MSYSHAYGLVCEASRLLREHGCKPNGQSKASAKPKPAKPAWWDRMNPIVKPARKPRTPAIAARIPESDVHMAHVADMNRKLARAARVAARPTL